MANIVEEYLLFNQEDFSEDLVWSVVYYSFLATLVTQIEISDNEINTGISRFQSWISDGEFLSFPFRRNQFSIGILDFFPFQSRTLSKVINYQAINDVDEKLQTKTGPILK